MRINIIILGRKTPYFKRKMFPLISLKMSTTDSQIHLGRIKRTFLIKKNNKEGLPVNNVELCATES